VVRPRKDVHSWRHPHPNVPCLGLLVHNAIRRPGRTLQRAHWLGILFVFLAYVPEVLFFLIVINRHTAIGDVELIRRLPGPAKKKTGRPVRRSVCGDHSA
jgi:hypothetical protein